MTFWVLPTFYCGPWVNVLWILWSFPVALPSGVSTWVYTIHILAINKCIKVIFVLGGGYAMSKNCPWISWLLTFGVLDYLMYMRLVDSKSICILTIFKATYLRMCFSSSPKKKMSTARLPMVGRLERKLGNRSYPIGSMYGIYTNMDHEIQLNVGKYELLGWYGYWVLFVLWRLWITWVVLLFSAIRWGMCLFCFSIDWKY